MKLEKIKEEDISRCVEIYNYYIVNTSYTLEEEKVTNEIFKERVNKISSRYPYVVYKDDNDAVLGYAYLHEFHERSAYKKTVELSLYVDINHLHEHIGQILFDNIYSLGKELGFTNIISIVTDVNKPSLSFHLKNRFVIEGLLHSVAFKLGQDISVYYLRKEIK